MYWLQEVIPKGFMKFGLNCSVVLYLKIKKTILLFIPQPCFQSECGHVSSVYVYLCVFMLYFLVLSGA